MNLNKRSQNTISKEEVFRMNSLISTIRKKKFLIGQAIKRMGQPLRKRIFFILKMLLLFKKREGKALIACPLRK